MFKLISVIFSTGVVVGAAGVLVAIRRGHMHLEPNRPTTETADEAEQPAATGEDSASDNGTALAEPVAHGERLGS